MKFSEFKYERPNVDEACDFINKLTESFKKASTADEQIKIIAEYRDKMSDIGSMRSLAHIRHTINTNDEFYLAERDYFNSEGPKLSNASVNFGKAVLESPYKKEISDEFGKMYIKNLEFSSKSMIPEIVPLMQEENELNDAYQTFNANAKVPYKGKEYTISAMTKLMNSDDRSERRAAAQALSDFYRSNKDFYEGTYDKLVKNRTKQAKMMGFNSYTELAYIRRNRNCYTAEDVANFRRQVVEDIVPVVTKLKKAQAERIGVDNLTFYDLSTSYPDGNPKTFEKAEDMIQATKETFEMLSPLMKEYIDYMIDNELYDAPEKLGKRVGAYTSSVSKYKAPFVFLNYNGTEDSIRTTFHEFGHGFNSYLLRNNPNSSLYGSSMEINETHSMSMEFLARPGMNKFFKPEDVEKANMIHLEGCLTFLCYGSMVDHFQHIVYDNPELTPDERNAEWRKLEKMYRPFISFDGIEYYEDGCLWQRQQHLYSAPFYYIDYVLAQTIALQFWALMDKDYDEALEKYVDFTSRSKEDTFTELVRSIGFKVPFEDGALVSIAETVDKAINA